MTNAIYQSLAYTQITMKNRCERYLQVYTTIYKLYYDMNTDHWLLFLNIYYRLLIS